MVLAIVQGSPAVPSGDALAPVVLALAVILAAAKLGGDAAERIGQPAVLGELVIGVLVGNLPLLGITLFQFITANATIGVMAQIGAVILLFEVGLESTVRDMMQVGLRSLVVAVLGVITPWALGWWVGALLLPNHSVYVHAFLGAALTATSVGITARVLKDLGHAQAPEARIILGAAVIDDVLGLVVLAGVAAVIAAADSGAALSYGALALVFGKALVFLIGSLSLGVACSRRLFGFASRLRGRGVLLATALVFCFTLAWLASAIGLAPIVGAYAAGLILEDLHYRDLAAREERQLEDLVRPISSFLVPVFFVLMGMRVDLGALMRPEILGVAAMLTLAAVVGKQACAFGALGTKLDWMSIGIGMIPRGEVGLIFANIGLTLVVRGEHIIDAGTYSAVVIMVMLTTLITPPALKWSLTRGARTEIGRKANASTSPAASVSRVA
ncbi:MAG TPA: cation:proton antiporter [Gemmatimonadaceae bacterium]|nr:cation:proton antiporter [Gemmatimonadaceae bacterium]